ncbi:type IV pilus assembly protein PilA [Peptoniphilus asaccharolyticus DSM 20463]|uniref:Type IV pilus assembly protein PilA n=1 Tax=Peptoniphilus asaccharolyticus DSM 20463 TaxID=573058 RepID=A0A1W1UTG8_PEPAS|nr:type II secretion system protein [Peptoniphilus asaccharolyticus]MBL7575168.1 type II secretion system protein [Peptoniphilus asaccharolyticus]SMB84397.1 type IV pilus assembly protein PilA [Peptoniphilus asaccharolyticus DSM 20463]
MKIVKKKKNGFTLVELVVVIAILLILVSIAIPRFTKSNLSAQAATHNLNVKEIKNAAIMYKMENPDTTGTISENDLKTYFEGDFPKPAKALKENSFTVSVANNGNVTVSPGEVKVEGDNLVAVTK